MFGYNVQKIRNDFPALSSKAVYLDSACMSLKPQCVLDAMNQYYTSFPACAGRSSHAWSKRVDEKIRETREGIASFINARHPDELIFTRNTTEAINLVARGLDLKKGDEVLISDKEHNSNLIPWLRLVKERGIVLSIVPSNPDNTFSLNAFKKLLTSKTKLVSIVHVSNLDGVENPIEEIVTLAHAHHARVLIDAAQSAPHKTLDVKKIGCDFLAFSGHKLLGPTGTGVLYGTREALSQLEPLTSGGGTVLSSTYTSFTPETGPAQFEAGLQDYAGILGLGAAITYLKKISLSSIEKHERTLNELATTLLAQIPGVEILGPHDPSKRAEIISFTLKGLDSLNAARMLSTSHNILIRGGMHCVHSWFNARKHPGTLRASFYIYNTQDDVRALVEGVKQLALLR